MCSCNQTLDKDIETWQQLGDVMSQESEDNYSAGWISEWEYTSWVRASHRSVAERLGGWVRWDKGVVDLVFVPMAEWLVLYAAWRARNLDWVVGREVVVNR